MKRLPGFHFDAKATLNIELRIIQWILNFGEGQGIVRNPIPRGRVEPYKLDRKTIYFEPDEWRALHRGRRR